MTVFLQNFEFFPSFQDQLPSSGIFMCLLTLRWSRYERGAEFFITDLIFSIFKLNRPHFMYSSTVEF